jgi:hypothetical protein
MSLSYTSKDLQFEGQLLIQIYTHAVTYQGRVEMTQIWSSEKWIK